MVLSNTVMAACAAMPWYDDNRSLDSVIPAQAGIRSSPLVNSNCGLAWVPASAGMTGGESGAFMAACSHALV